VISGSSRLTRPAHADGHEAGIAPARGAPDNQQERKRELEDPEQPGRARQRVDGQHVVVSLTAAGQDVYPAGATMCPPRVGCALGATEVQSSRENPDLVYTQINEDTPFAGTLRPIRRRDKDDRGRGGAAPPSGRKVVPMHQVTA
jgi:hypothetical protein